MDTLWKVSGEATQFLEASVASYPKHTLPPEDHMVILKSVVLTYISIVSVRSVHSREKILLKGKE